MRICCTADLHGRLPVIPPDSDIVIVAGDILPNLNRKDYQTQAAFLNTNFRAWLEKIGDKCPIVGIAGNHDWLFHDRPDLVPELPWNYLLDSEVKVNGLKIYGTPYHRWCGNWVFGKTEIDLLHVWLRVPTDTDILVTHGPPAGCGDYIPEIGDRVGSPGLAVRLKDLNCKLCVCGHIHQGHGIYPLGDTLVVNAAHTLEPGISYNEPIVMEI